MRVFLMLLFWAVVTPLAALVVFPWTLITGDACLLYRTGMKVAQLGLRICGVRVIVEGREALRPGANYIFMSNHASNLDPAALLPAIPGRTSVLVKRELFNVPVLARAMTLTSLVPVDRRNREDAIRSVHAAENVLAKGLSMTIFVEGTRSRTGELLPFKKGPFHLAMHTGVPVVPVTIVGTHALWPKGRLLARTGVVRIVFHPSISPRDFDQQEDLVQAVRERIASLL